MKARKLVFYLLLFLLISFGIYFLGLKIKSEDIARFVGKTGFWAPFIYIIIFALTHIIAPLSGTPVFFAGYVLFNSRIQIYTTLATFLSATINFWIARIWGRSFAARLAGRKNIEKIDQFTKDYGIKSLILLRVFQGQFTDFISYAYGLTNMKFIPYILITVLASIPWLLLWQLYLFKRIDNIQQFTMWFFLTLIPLFIISGLFFKKYRNKK